VGGRWYWKIIPTPQLPRGNPGQKQASVCQNKGDKDLQQLLTREGRTSPGDENIWPEFVQNTLFYKRF
jgi:hypothetical protein